jgi:hypothetical protein
MRGSVWVGVAVVALSAVAVVAQISSRDGITLPNPPVVKMMPVVDDYQSADAGVATKITDPYRWLEDAHSPETGRLSRRRTLIRRSIFRR